VEKHNITVNKWLLLGGYHVEMVCINIKP